MPPPSSRTALSTFPSSRAERIYKNKKIQASSSSSSRRRSRSGSPSSPVRRLPPGLRHPFSAFVSSSAAAFVSSTRPRLTSPSHRAKPSFLRGLRRVVDCRFRSPAARHPVRFSSSSLKGREGPSFKFLGLLWSSTDPATPVFALPPISRSRRFFRVSPLFFGVPPTF